MKKIFVCMLILFSAISGAFAQRGRGADPHWLTLAVKGGYGNSILFCKEINDNEDFNQNFMSPSFSFGGKLGVVLKDRFGITCEVLSSNYKNKFEVDKTVKVLGQEIGGKYKDEYAFKTLDILAGFRYTSPAGVFVEFGPKFTMIKKVNFDVDLEISQGPVEVTNQFVEKYVSPFFGFGVTPYNGDRFQVTIGLRGAYCPKNILNQEAINISIVTPTVTDKVSPFSAQALLELNYYFATFGKATCGKGAIKFF